MLVGYARVLMQHQDLAQQLDALRAGAPRLHAQGGTLPSLLSTYRILS